MLKTLYPYVGEYKKPTLLAMLMMGFEVAMEVSIPLLMKNIVDIGITNNDISYIFRTGLLMIFMSLLSLLFGGCTSRFSSTAGAGFAKNLRMGLFNKVQDFSFSNMDKFNTASLVTRLTTDVNSVQNTYMMANRLAVRAPIMLICASFMAISINAELALIYLLALPVLAGLMGIIMRFAYPRFRKMLKEYDTMNRVVQENLIGIRVVKAFVREGHEEGKFNDASGRVKNALFKAEVLVVWIMPIMQIVMFSVMIAIVWFGGNKIIMGEMLIGGLMSFITYSTQILMSLMMLGMVLMMYIFSKASITRIIEVLKEEPDIINPEAAGYESVPDGSVEYKNVTFRYNEASEEPTLSGISFSIQAGETVGIIGSTGSAKTTLVQLIPRLYDVQDGSVLVGGHDVKAYELKVLRDSVAMVLQKNVLFSGSIKDNLKWGNPDATDEQIAEACRIAQAHEFIMSFPDGYDTQLGQGGVNVSGGQKQRLTIARALLKGPKIMILDDSTSAVDTATDSKLRAGLKESLHHMTTIIIAQRVASVMDADKIVVMDEGKITAIGTHKELLTSSSIYKDICALQQKGGATHGA